MIATLNPSQTQRVTLDGISWHTYRAMLRDMGNHRATRLLYDQGYLEITMPSELHEIINRLIDRIITALTEELGLKIKAYGSTTLDREDLAKGIEPDSCYYIQNADQIQTRCLNLETDPPPDLAVEVDITSSSQRRFTLYQSLQIPEVWRYTEKQGIVFYQLQAGEYCECCYGSTFSMVSSAKLLEFLAMAEDEDDNTVIRAVRSWIRAEQLEK
ncbi:MAG: Uma2 family endonuclease [Cyanobacteria bacterium P01_A01_bin.123]